MEAKDIEGSSVSGAAESPDRRLRVVPILSECPVIVTSLLTYGCANGDFLDVHPSFLELTLSSSGASQVISRGSYRVAFALYLKARMGSGHDIAFERAQWH